MVVVVSVSGLVLLDWMNNMKNSTCFSCVCPSEHVCRAYMNYMVATELEHCTNTSCRLHDYDPASGLCFYAVAWLGFCWGNHSLYRLGSL